MHLRTALTRQGFTLPELAIVMIVAGMLMSAALALYRDYSAGASYRETVEHVQVAQQALGEYFSRRGCYPAPADPSLAPGDVGYGRQIYRRYGFQGCPAGLVCLEAGSFSRDANADGVEDPILIGALPILDLADGSVVTDTQIFPYMDYDGNSLEFTYAVSELMTGNIYSAPNSCTVTNTVNPNLGALSVVDETGASVIDPPGSAHYVIFSHGRDARGAYSKTSNVPIQDCLVPGTVNEPDTGFDPVNNPTALLDLENCDNNDAIFLKSYLSLAEGNNYYDDYVFFESSASQNIWERSLTSPGSETWLYNSNLGFVGVGTDDPVAEVDVNGSVRAQTRIEADEGYCTLGESECVKNDTLFNKACPSGQAAIGIKNSKLICAAVFTGNPPVFSCDPGEYVTRLSNLGNYECAPLP